MYCAWAIRWLELYVWLICLQNNYIVVPAGGNSDPGLLILKEAEEKKWNKQKRWK